MRWLLFSTMSASFLAIVIVSFAPTLGGVVFGIAVVLWAVTEWKTPSTERREQLHYFRVEITLALATIVGVLAMAFGPALPTPWRGYFGLLWLAVVYAYLAMLGLKGVRIINGAMRRD